MEFKVSHTTSYDYDSGVTFCHNIATLKPKTMVGQTLLDYDLEISPKPSEITERLDFFGNTITRFSIQQHHKKLKVTAKSIIERNYKLEPNIEDSETGKTITLNEALSILKTNNKEFIDIKQFILESIFIAQISPEVKAYAEKSFKPNRPVFEAAFELMQRIFTEFKFDSEFSTIATPIQEVIKAKKGVCQDFAQIAIACVRSMGLPARYVSGYIETLPPPGKEKLVGTDASHAWFSVYIPKFGWVDFDPTNNQIPKNQHITVSWGRDYYDVPPLKGVVYSTGKNKMNVAVDIRPA
ncbi:transglutaminase family protein [Formosa algae]|jgi:transglutaminase-like putative cysteine protease|uniref:Transglutaminase-like putative cysteine protease n=1 Tax=Formosa algae TaxID=225843 RepID=A0A9X0YIT5_9FLAO|nr:transglutaminase family protein [Formosa algae]MBP1839275.1 transglutaminase-like putative cysteine protease [Formosa algae]MDQ0334052.1 transglutaminase-like putative cysteine protease [Formosa algae]OEI79379.1 transglutaminase [Formosa algae]PNW26992.1 transglutaminase [Formosa algae]